MQVNSHTKLSGQVMLKVKRTPVILNNSTKSLFITEGQEIENIKIYNLIFIYSVFIRITGEPVNLECYAKGYPVPRISWKRTNAGILPAPHVGSTYRYNLPKNFYNLF